MPTLLLADDSVTIQRVIELTFADEDVQVIAVSDGDQAIAHLNAHPPDIVLADVGMPGKNGYEVAQYMRQSPRLQHIPIVLLTGAFEPVDQERATEAGCDGILQKPFEPQQVVGRVRELLARGAKPGASPLSDNDPFGAPPTGTPAGADVLWPAATAHAAPGPAEPLVTGAAAPVAAPAGNDYFDKLDAAFATLTKSPAAPVRPASPMVHPPSVVAPQAGAAGIDWLAPPANPPAVAAEPWDLPGPAAASAPDDLPLTRFEEPAVIGDLNIIDNGAEVFEASAEVPGAEVPSAVHGAEVLSAPVPPPPAPQHVAPHPAPQHQAPQHLAPQHPAAHVEPQPPVVQSAPGHPALHSAPQRPAPQHPIALPSIADAFAALLAAEANDSGPAPSWPVSVAPSAPPVDIEDLVERVTRKVIDRLGDAVVQDAVRDATSLIAERLVTEEIERIKSSIK